MGRKRPHVVLAVSAFNMGHLLPLCFKGISRLDPKPDFLLFWENNSTDDTLVQMWQFDLGVPKKIIRMWFRRDALSVVTNPFEFMSLTVEQHKLIYARRLDPDYYFVMPADVFLQTPDAISILTDWDVDGIVGARVLRTFPNGVYISARWPHPQDDGSMKYLVAKQCKHKLFKVVDKEKGLDIAVAHPLGYTSPMLDTSLYAIGFGFVCITRKLLQDRRVNFWPQVESPRKGDPISDDFGYCVNAKRLGYTIALDGLVIADHVIVDAKHDEKMWQFKRRDVFRFPRGDPDLSGLSA